jgi:hypothetical protein
MPPEMTAEQKARDALAMNPFPPTPWVTVTEEGIFIAAGYSEALNRLLRWVPKAKWRQDKRRWMIPLSGAEAVRAVLPEITRLAEAAQELNAAETPAKAGPSEAEPLSPGLLAEAAALLYGPDWRAALARDFGEAAAAGWAGRQDAFVPGDGLVAALVAGLRRKAEALALAADRIEAGLPSAAP